ncbi:MAG: 1-acyl-sn-glycerol-3-phosphate acyltransferase [Candidatus Altiarchaeota archaeon]
MTAIIDSYKRAYGIAEATLDERRELGFAPRIPESANLFDILSKAVIDRDTSTFNFPEGFANILKDLDSGRNVVLAVNHGSYADNLAVHALLDHTDPELNRRALYIASTPRRGADEEVFFNGVDRIQVYSDSMVERATDDMKRKMKAQNLTAIKDFMRLLMGGGYLVIIYPEGEFNDGRLMRGSLGSSVIFEAVSRYSPKGSELYPVYIDGAQEILPPGMFSDTIPKTRRGPVNIQVGRPSDLHQMVFDLSGEDLKSRRRLVDAVMGKIAELAPKDRRGHYGGA